MLHNFMLPHCLFLKTQRLLDFFSYMILFRSWEWKRVMILKRAGGLPRTNFLVFIICWKMWVIWVRRRKFYDEQNKRHERSSRRYFSLCVHMYVTTQLISKLIFDSADNICEFLKIPFWWHPYACTYLALFFVSQKYLNAMCLQLLCSRVH